MSNKPSTYSFETDDDFGFSTVSEQELKQYETELQATVEQQHAVISQQQEASLTAQQRLDALYKAILPLLVNLSKNPEKEYILWPDRAARIAAFRQKIDGIVNGE